MQSLEASEALPTPWPQQVGDPGGGPGVAQGVARGMARGVVRGGPGLGSARQCSAVLGSACYC